jgi:hypothetical protein
LELLKRGLCIYGEIPRAELRKNLDLNARFASFLSLLGYTGLLLDSDNPDLDGRKTIYFKAMLPFAQLNKNRSLSQTLNRPGAREIRSKIWFVAADLVNSVFTSDWEGKELKISQINRAERDHASTIRAVHNRLKEISDHPKEKLDWWFICIQELDRYKRSQFAVMREICSNNEGDANRLAIEISINLKEAFEEIENVDSTSDHVASAANITSVINNLKQLSEIFLPG